MLKQGHMLGTEIVPWCVVESRYPVFLSPSLSLSLSFSYYFSFLLFRSNLPALIFPAVIVVDISQVGSQSKSLYIIFPPSSDLLSIIQAVVQKELLFGIATFQLRHPTPTLPIFSTSQGPITTSFVLQSM